MLALFTELPQFCPRCGRPIEYRDADNRREALGGVAQCCLKCGATYATVARETFLQGAGLSDTDLVDQVRRGGD